MNKNAVLRENVCTSALVRIAKGTFWATLVPLCLEKKCEKYATFAVLKIRVLNKPFSYSLKSFSVVP